VPPSHRVGGKSVTSSGHEQRLFDRELLEEYLREQLGPAEHSEIVRHPGGHSNETLFIEWDGQYVLRRPPIGSSGGKAHDMLREYRIIDALQSTDVPVAETVFACSDPSIIGAEFYLMRRCQGDVYRPSNPPSYTSSIDRRAVGMAQVDTLARIHQVDVSAAGLGDLGHPSGFTARQIDIWDDQLQAAREVTHAERPINGTDAIVSWLRANRPEMAAPTLVHGDYKLDNLMYHPDDPRSVIAVFDWELCTVGDPLTDLGWMLLFWHDPGDLDVAMPNLMPRFTQQEGFPTRQSLIERYTELTGNRPKAMDFYEGLAAFKMIALGEMFLARHLRGESDDPLYPKMRSGVPELIDQTRGRLDC
jgi:aminoglycoside phosphotransferase (APT) family kinase protein